MTDKIKNIAVTVSAAVIIFGLALWNLLKPDDEFSDSERRRLASMPELSVQNIFHEKGGDSFMMEFEKYAADQFPMRDMFRRLNSVFGMYCLGEKEINGIYIKDGYAAALEYPISHSSLEWALGRFEDIAARYLDGRRAYIAVVPDKGYYLAGDKSYPSMDYGEFFDTVKNGSADYADYIDLTGILSIENYYFTDTHWRQESIIPVAEHIAESMGRELDTDYRVCTLEKPFYGVYCGQLALPLKPDTVRYLISDSMEQARVCCFDSGRAEELPMYDMEKAYGRDGYEMFLSGARALITVENPLAQSDGELVIFRDSFASSLAPLLAGAYAKITLVDIRYISPAFVGNFVDFENADVLFLYSTLVLNNSEGQLLK